MNNTPNKNVDYYVSTDGGRGAFSCTLSNLLPSRTYYYRAYAKDSHGTLSYGETHSFNTGTSSNGEEENNSDEYQSLRFNINDLCGYWRAIAAYRNDTTYTPLGNDYHELKSSLEYFNEFVHNKGYGYVIEGYWMLNSDNYYTVTETIYADFDASHHYSNGQDIYRTNQWKVKELRKYNDGRLYLLMTGGTWRVLGGARCDMIIYEYISSKRVIEQTKQHTLNEIDMKKIKNIFPTNNIVNINKAYKINE